MSNLKCDFLNILIFGDFFGFWNDFFRIFYMSGFCGWCLSIWKVWVWKDEFVWGGNLEKLRKIENLVIFWIFLGILLIIQNNSDKWCNFLLWDELLDCIECFKTKSGEKDEKFKKLLKIYWNLRKIFRILLIFLKKVKNFVIFCCDVVD